MSQPAPARDPGAGRAAALDTLQSCLKLIVVKIQQQASHDDVGKTGRNIQGFLAHVFRSELLKAE